MNPADYQVPLFLAQTLASLGRKQEEMIACFCAIQGDHERAIGLLERAVELGWGDLAWMKHDSDLDPLHGHPRFEALIASIRQAGGRGP